MCENKCQVLLMWTLLIISSRESELAVILPSNPLSLSPPVVCYVSCPSFPPSLSCDTASRRAVCSDCLSPAVPLQSICLYFRSLSILIDSYQDLLGCFRPLTHTHKCCSLLTNHSVPGAWGSCDSESLRIWE